MRISFNRKGSQLQGYDPAKELPVYGQSYVGNALKILIARGTALTSDVDPRNIIARGQNFNYTENYQLLPVIEWDTYFIQELLLGMQEMGSFDCQAMFSLRLNDALPSVKTLAWETELTGIESVGQDHPQAGMVLNSFWGMRFSGNGSNLSPTGIVMISIRGMYRYRLTGKDWKMSNPKALYPYMVNEVNMGTELITP